MKYGNKVVVKEKGFYNGARGIVVCFNQHDSTYTVHLEYGRQRDFYGTALNILKEGVKKNG